MKDKNTYKDYNTEFTETQQTKKNLQKTLKMKDKHSCGHAEEHRDAQGTKTYACKLGKDQGRKNEESHT